MIEFILFVTLVTLTPNKLQYIHSPPEIFILSFSLRFLPSNAAKNAHLEGNKKAADMRAFFSQKSLANLNYFTLNERANNFTSDGGKLIAVCYSQQKLQSFKKFSPMGTLLILGYTNTRN